MYCWEGAGALENGTLKAPAVASWFSIVRRSSLSLLFLSLSSSLFLRMTCGPQVGLICTRVVLGVQDSRSLVIPTEKLNVHRHNKSTSCCHMCSVPKPLLSQVSGLISCRVARAAVGARLPVPRGRWRGGGGGLEGRVRPQPHHYRVVRHPSLSSALRHPGYRLRSKLQSNHLYTRADLTGGVRT